MAFTRLTTCGIWILIGAAGLFSFQRFRASHALHLGLVGFKQALRPHVGNLGLTQFVLADHVVNLTRLIRAKQRGGETEQIIEEVEMSTMLHNLMNRLRAKASNPKHGWVLPNTKGNVYTAQAFKLGWNRLKKAARKAGALTVELNDLGAYYVTQFKKKHGNLPDLHKDPATTARVYDSSSVVGRKSL